MTDQQRPTLYLPTLDGLRFVAFGLVFIHHLPPSEVSVLRVVHDVGYVGVCLFLTLSAYLLSRILASEFTTTHRVGVRNFFIRRALRIWPLYFAFVVPIGLWACTRSDAAPSSWLRFGGLLVFVDNLFTSVLDMNPLPFVSHLWTVSLEEHFYLLLPFVLAALLGHTQRLIAAIKWGLVLLIVARVVAVVAGARHPFIWASVLSGDPILFGVLLALGQWTWPTHRVMRVALVCVGLGLLGAVALLPDISTNGWHQVVLFAQIGVGTTLVSAAAVADPAFRVLAWAPLRYLGKISYGLYVFHLLAIKLTERLSLSSWWATAAVSLVLTIFLSALSYELFEKRFLKLKARFEVIKTRPA